MKYSLSYSIGRFQDLLGLDFIIIPMVVAFITIPACFPFGATKGAGRNVLTVKNGTNDFALVRIKRIDGVTQAELAIDAGRSKTCRLPNGSYYEIVRFGRIAENYRYEKGEGFEFWSPNGLYIRSSLTIHSVIGGKYSRHPATAEDFQ